ncbi:uncharacterized protein KGF55_002402 [Candida pseudojiufengensis]|uniref:uncharacterized protein n=1 Tax=Candida pseudojiufengensis TaxID=497109 RepID=UPI0022252577|nr:uncharacterized protein KGF55_002402 [Candida pseudojiufengensis]KAI5963522.1 hypothetical protein KGF55_002402 [Candida pseudojiufengensis]
MSISSKSLPTFKQIYRSISKELLIYENKTIELNSKNENKKLITYYNYLKQNAIKNGKTNEVNELNEKLKNLSSQTTHKNKELKDLNLLNNIIDDKIGINNSYELNNLNNVLIYLKNQREYFELLIRYNPGLIFDQQENVQKSANRVGLDVPQ